MNKYHALPDRQSGAALVVAIIILLVLTIIGVSAMSSGILNEKMSNNLAQRTIGFNAAQSALNAFALDFSNGGNLVVQTVAAAEKDGALADLPVNTAAHVVCNDEEGKLVDCSGVSLQSGADALLKAKSSSVYKAACADFSALACPGTSVREGFGCHFFDVRGDGWFDNDSDNIADAGEYGVAIEESAYLVRPCSDKDIEH